jgi:phenylpyruvate tautomerase PptA (4-oxalocrotonate tautomerase family)
MPVYTCTTTSGTLAGSTKRELAAEITRVHAEINHVPATYVNVVFLDVAPHDLYTDSQPANPLLINGWVRQGHPAFDTTRLALAVAAAGSRVTGLATEQVLVVIQNSPAHGAVEGGRVLPEPGQESAWLSGH